MSSAQKEQIYVELRDYHLDELPESFTSTNMNDLLLEYRKLEDEIITMIMRLVNGKSEYVDLSQHLTDFLDKANFTAEENKAEAQDRKHFVDKSKHLGRILEIASTASFTIRPPVKTRESSRPVVIKVNKK